MTWRHALVGAGLAVAAAVGLRAGLGLHGAAGTDAALWGLTALDLGWGATPLVPPGYPALVALVHALGTDLVSAGLVVSTCTAALLPVAVSWAARQAGADAGLAVVAGVIAAVGADAAAWSQQLQPDGLTAVLLVVTGGLMARGSARAWLGAAIVAGFTALVREHGVALVGVVALGALAWRQWRVPPAAVAAWWLAPLCALVAPGGHPGRVPWADRSGGALAVFTADDAREIGFLHQLGPDAQAYAAMVEAGDRLGQLGVHAAHSLSQAALLWGVLGTALVVLLVRPRAPAVRLALPLITALPALVIWSQRRHVAVVVPVALAVMAAAGGRSAPTNRRRLAAAGLAGALALTVIPWPQTAAGLRSETQRADRFAEVAAWLQAHAGPHAMLGGVFQDIGLYAPMPRHDPDGSAADWQTWVVADGPPHIDRSLAASWERVWRSPRDLEVWRLAPEAAPRPCSDAAPAPDTPHVAAGRAHATLIGCDTPAPGASSGPPVGAPQ